LFIRSVGYLGVNDFKIKGAKVDKETRFLQAKIDG
jgi:hypothetical protein